MFHQPLNSYCSKCAAQLVTGTYKGKYVKLKQNDPYCTYFILVSVFPLDHIDASGTWRKSIQSGESSESKSGTYDKNSGKMPRLRSQPSILVHKANSTLHVSKRTLDIGDLNAARNIDILNYYMI